MKKHEGAGECRQLGCSDRSRSRGVWQCVALLSPRPLGLACVFDTTYRYVVQSFKS